MQRLFQLADRIAVKLAADQAEPASTPLLTPPVPEFPEIPDTSFGKNIVIPGPSAAWLKKLICQTFKLVSEDTKLGQLIDQFEKALPEIRSAHTQMIRLIIDSKELTLKGLAARANKVLITLETARANIHKVTTVTALGRTIDIELHRVVSNLWKAVKRVYSAPQLKGHPVYTYQFGSGANPAKPVQKLVQTIDQKERKRITTLDPFQEDKDHFKRMKEEKKRVPSFNDYEQYLEEDGQKYVPTETEAANLLDSKIR